MNKTMTRAQLKISGLALATVLLLLLVITLVATVSLRMSKEQQTMSLNLKQLTRAQFAAEQAVREAIDLPIWSVDPDPNNPDLTWEHEGSGSGTDYSFVYRIKHKIATGSVAVDSEGFPYYAVEAEGVSGNGRRQVEVGVVSQYESVSAVDDAFIGCRGVPFNSNANVSSYNSSGVPTDGNNAIVRTLEPPGDLILDSNADVYGNIYVYGDFHMDSNARARKDVFVNGDITMDSNSDIYGNAWAGGSISPTGNADIHGTTNANQPGSLAPSEDCDPLGIDSFIATNAGHITAVNNTNSSNTPSMGTAFSSGGSTHTNVQAGDKYFSSFDMDSNATMTLEAGEHVWMVDGDFLLNSNSNITLAAGASLEIYITGRFVLESNTAIVNNGVPADLLIFSNATDNNLGDDDDAEVQMLSNSSFVGVIYAPEAHVVFNSNSDAYGAVRGRWAQMDSNADFFYDETLGELVETSQEVDLGYKIVYWTEQSYDSYTSLASAVATTTSGGVTTTSVTTSTTGSSTTTSSSTTASSTVVTTTGTGSAPTTTAGPSFVASNFQRSAGDKRYTFTLTNTSGGTCTLEGVDFTSWPNNGDFEKLDIAGNQVTEGDETGAPASINNGVGASQSWKSDSLPYREFPANQSRQLDFRFKNNAKKGTYIMTLRFSEGCDDLNVTHTFN